MGCAPRETDSVVDHLHLPTEFGSVRNVGNDGPKSLLVPPRLWGRRSQVLKYSPIGDNRLGCLISEKSWTLRVITSDSSSVKGEDFPKRALMRRFLQTKEKGDGERGPTYVCILTKERWPRGQASCR